MLMVACSSSSEETSGFSGSTPTASSATSSTTAGPDPTEAPATDAGTAGISATGTGDPTSTASSTATGEATDGGPKLDLGVSVDFGGNPGQGCSKVDFLFVVDNSISMGDEQQNLATSFPSFISTIQSQVAADDYHIMMIDTDDLDKWGEKWNKCHEKCMTDDPGDGCLTVYFDDIICGMEPPPPEACDQTLGAGRNKGAGGPPVVCPIDGGGRFMTQDQTDLAATFDCVAKMGATGNSNERPAAALLAALGEQTQAGGCHPGFLRDDAVLVLTIISDEEEIGSPGDPKSWYAELLARKQGNTTSIVSLVLSGDTNIMGQECTPTPKWTELTDLVGPERGIIESICQPDYGPFFTTAVSVIDYACDTFVPPG
jgi:hypothetical protein